eukprot:12408817-Karenia_brevis.AAC.1
MAQDLCMRSNAHDEETLEILNDLSNGQIAYLQKRMKEEYDKQYPPGLAAAAASDTPIRWGEDNIKCIAEALYQPDTT